MPKFKTAIFIHGYFWHMYSCRKNLNPSSSQEYWIKKFKRNEERFKEVKESLINKGWKVLVIRKCETKKEEKIIENHLMDKK